MLYEKREYMSPKREKNPDLTLASKEDYEACIQGCKKSLESAKKPSPGPNRRKVLEAQIAYYVNLERKLNELRKTENNNQEGKDKSDTSMDTHGG